MTSLGLGDIARFPFVEPPDRRNVTAGVQLLEELGAFAATGRSTVRLTRTGKRLARLPIDPRLGRMILEAERLGCVREVLVIAAALSLQDPRERPVEQRPQADQQHARFKDERERLPHLAQPVAPPQGAAARAVVVSAFRRMCKREFLNYLRVREWQDFESQLRQVCKRDEASTSGNPPTPPDADGIHQALLSGLLSHIGLLEERDRKDAAGRRPMREYLGARGTRFAIFPGSGLKGRTRSSSWPASSSRPAGCGPGRTPRSSRSGPSGSASHLVKRTYCEPHWSQKRAAVMARERVTLYGVPLVADRLVSYGKVDPALARELFVRHALVYGEWRTHHRFFADNRALLEEAEELEHRARRRDLVVDEHTLFDFYDARIPEEVVSGAHFDQWWKQERRREHPDLLTFDPAMLTHDTAEEVSEADYPRARGSSEGLTFPISYHFEPGAADDGHHHRRPRRHPQPGRGRRLLLERPRPAGTSWSPACCAACPSTCGSASCRRPTPPGSSSPRCRPARSRCSTPSSGTCGPDDRGRRPPRGLGLVQGAPSTCARPTACVDEHGRGAGPRQGPRGAQGAAAGAVRRRDGRGRRRHRPPPAETTWTFGDGPRRADLAARRPRGPRLPGARRRGRHGRAAGLRVGRRGRRAAPARRRPAAAARPAAARRPGRARQRRPSSGSPGRRTRSVAELVDDVPARGGAGRGRRPARRSATRRRTTPSWPTCVDDLEPRMRELLGLVGDVLARWRATDKSLAGRADLAVLRLAHRHARPARPAGPPRLRRRGRAGAAAALPGLPRRARPPARPARRAAGAGPAAARAGGRPAGGVPPPGRRAARRAGRRAAALREVRWLLEEYRVSLWAQQLGTAQKVSDQRIRKALAAGVVAFGREPTARTTGPPRRAAATSRRSRPASTRPSCRRRPTGRPRCWCAVPTTAATTTWPSGCSTSPTPRASRPSPRCGRPRRATRWRGACGGSTCCARGSTPTRPGSPGSSRPAGPRRRSRAWSPGWPTPRAPTSSRR